MKARTEILLGVVLGILLIVGIKSCVSETPAQSDGSGIEAIISAANTAAIDKLPAYDTLEEAALHAMERAYRCSHVYECGGVIAKKPDGKFVVGPVSSAYAGDHTEISFSAPDPLVVVADYHTHPCMPDSHNVPFFSPADISGNLTSKLPGFMGDLCTGDVHEFDPSRDSPNNELVPGHDQDVYSTRGRIVGHFVVDGVNVEPTTGMI